VSPRRPATATACDTTPTPRDCMPQAPGKVKFQGIVTEGLYDNDNTRTSDPVRKG